MKESVPYPSIDTPSILLNLNQWETNIQEMTHLAREAGVRLRPHIKMHECGMLAKMQIQAGACGIEVGNVAQAELMASEGINDIVVAHPFYGARKFEAFQRLLSKPGLKLGVVVDMFEQAEELSKIGQFVGKKIPVLIKLDTGVNRYGVLPGISLLDLARQVQRLPGIEIAGIYAHESGAVPTDEGVAKAALETGSIMAEMARMLRAQGIAVPEVTVGASPTFRGTCRYIREGLLKEITEIHPGACAVGDLMYVKSHGNTRAACALTVLTTVVSTSHPGHVIIDAGYKTFGKDSLIEWRDNPGFFWNGYPSFGSVQGRPDLWLGKLGAESGWLFYKEPDSKRLYLGDRLEIVPNNATLVMNIHDEIYGVREGAIEKEIPVTGRGRGS